MITRTVEKIAVSYRPPPAAIPIPAATKIVAAEVKPDTEPLSCRMAPAPMKPMPVIICAAILVWSATSGPASLSDRMVNMAEPKHMNMTVRSPVGRCFSSRSSPIAAPRAAARIKRPPAWKPGCELAKGVHHRWADCNKAREAVVLTSSVRVPPLIDGAASLSRRAYRQQLCQLGTMWAHRQPHRVPLARDHVVGRTRGIEQRPFPVRMLRFSDNVTTRDGCQLQRTGTLAAIHE